MKTTVRGADVLLLPLPARAGGADGCQHHGTGPGHSKCPCCVWNAARAASARAVARKVPSTSVARVHGAITAAARGRADRQERGVVVPVALEVVCQAAVSGPGAPMAALTVSCCGAVTSKAPASLWSPAV